MAARASAAGLEVLAPERVGDILGRIRDLEPDVGVVVAYGQIIPKDLIDAFEFGIVNLHFSLLPRWRGAAPVQRAILAGDQTTGVCTMLIDEGLDTGPILECLSTEIAPQERAGELEARLAEMGAPLVVSSVDKLLDGRILPEPQPSEGVTYARPLRREECSIEWGSPAVEVERLVRAAYPRPGAFTQWRGSVLKIHRARAVVQAQSRSAAGGARGQVEVAVPGTIVGLGQTLVVACGEGYLEVYELQAAGRKAMSAPEFVRGARITEGEVLGRI